MSVDPHGLTLKDWADSVILTVPNSWLLGRLDSDDRWQEWATGLVRAGSFSQRNLPNPYNFTDWKDWAMRVYPMLEGNA